MTRRQEEVNRILNKGANIEMDRVTEVRSILASRSMQGTSQGERPLPTGMIAEPKWYEQARNETGKKLEDWKRLNNQKWYEQWSSEQGKAYEDYKAERKRTGREQQIEQWRNSEDSKRREENWQQTFDERKAAVSMAQWENDPSLAPLREAWRGNYRAYLGQSLPMELDDLETELQALQSGEMRDPGAADVWRKKTEQEYNKVLAQLLDYSHSGKSNQYRDADPHGIDPYGDLLVKKRDRLYQMLNTDLSWQKAYYDAMALQNNADFSANKGYQSTKTNSPQKTYLSDPFGLYDDESDSGYEDPLYEAVNGNEEMISWLSNRAHATYSNDGALTQLALGVEYDYSEVRNMEPEEVSVFNYIYATQGRDAAHKFYENLRSQLKGRELREMLEYDAQYARDHKWEASLGSVALKPLGMLTLGAQIGDYIATGKVDPNASYNIFAAAPAEMRNAVAEEIKNGRWGKVGSYGYQLAMGLADFAFTAAMTGSFSGGGAISNNAALAIMGSSTAADTVISAKARGLDDTDAFALGMISGLAEALMEKIGLDELLGTQWSKGILRGAIKNGFAEAGEEIGTEVINTMADLLISMDKSQWAANVRDYTARGFSQEEAFAKAFGDKAAEAGLAGLGGLLSGFAMGGGFAGIDALSGRIGNKQTAVPNVGTQDAAQAAGALPVSPVQTAKNPLMQAAMEMTGAAATEVSRWNEAAARAFGETGSKAFSTMNDGSVDPQRLYEGFSVMYNAGQTGKAMADVKQPAVNALSKLQARVAYDAGQKDAEISLKNREAAAGVGVVSPKDAGFKYNEYSKKLYRTEYRKIDAVARALGRKVVMEDLGSEDNGFVDENGVIHMDIRTDDPVMYVAAHEVTHIFEDQAPAEHKEYRDYAVNKMAEIHKTTVQQLILEKRAEYEGRQYLTDEQAMNELTASFTKEMMRRKDLFEEFAKQNTTAAQRFLDAVVELLQRIKAALSRDKAAFEKEVGGQFGADVFGVDEAVHLWAAALDRAKAVSTETQKAGIKKTAQQGGDFRGDIKGKSFAEDKYFARQMDRWSELADGIRIKVGTVRTNSALNKVGLPASDMYFHVGKIRKAMSKHNDHLVPGVLKGIPDLLNDPIVITEYRGAKGNIENTVSVYGNLFLPNSATPIVVGIVMRRDINGQTIINNIRTVHARGDFANQITDESVLYLNEDKRKTRKWFHVCGILNVPLNGTKYGFVRSIAFSDGSVKTESATTTEEITTNQSRQSQKGKTKVDEAFDRLHELIELYGEIPEGENPFRDLQAPKKSSRELNSLEAQRVRDRTLQEQGRAVVRAGKTVGLINRAIRMEGTRSQELARKLRDKGQFNNEAAVGELYTQILQDGGDVSAILGGTDKGSFELSDHGMADVDAAIDTRDELEKIPIRGTCQIRQGIAAFPKDDALYERIKLVEPDGEKFDVALHGSTISVGFGSREANMSPRLLAEVIKHSEAYRGQEVRLLSCCTGQVQDTGLCFAEELANALGQIVYAPNDLLFVSRNGTITIGKYGTGRMIPYKPNERRRIK